MENILEELNEGVAIADDQLRVIFANEANEPGKGGHVAVH
jgi:translation elongation factor P/translation initiation factor 5A